MNIYDTIVAICWIAFVVYWLVSSIGIKKNRKNKNWWQGIALRIGATTLVLLLLTVMPQLRHPFRDLIYKTPLQNPIIGCIGVILCVLGIGLAFWARIHIGKNWGQPMTIKEQPELVTSGPYGYVRHPIYAGIMLAIFGSILVSNILWTIPFVYVCIYFLYSAKTEERNMTKVFPKAYPEYVKRTKRLIPFVY